MIRWGAAVALAACLCAARPAAAQSPAPAPPRRSLKQLEAALSRARLERDIGWGAAGLGLALAASGAVMATVGPYDASYDRGAAYLNGGGVIAGVGGAIAIAGAVLALYGQNAMTDLRAAIEQLGMRMPRMTAGLTPTGGGLLAAARVRF